MLRVRVAEMQRSVLKQLGIDLEAVFSVGNFTADLLNVNPFTLSTVGSLNARQPGPQLSRMATPTFPASSPPWSATACCAPSPSRP